MKTAQAEALDRKETIVVWVATYRALKSGRTICTQSVKLAPQPAKRGCGKDGAENIIY